MARGFGSENPTLPILPERQGSNRGNIRAGVFSGENGRPTRYMLSFNSMLRGPVTEEVQRNDGNGTYQRNKSVGAAEVTVWFNYPEQWQAAIDAAKRADEIAIPGFQIAALQGYRRQNAGAGEDDLGASIKLTVFPSQLFFHLKPRRFPDNSVQFLQGAEAAYERDYGTMNRPVQPDVLGEERARRQQRAQQHASAAPAADPLAQDMQGVDLDGLAEIDLDGINIDELGIEDIGEVGAPPAPNRR